MTSVCTCYCKHEGNVTRKEDNDIRTHNGNRHPTTAVSRKPTVTNTTRGGGRESCKRARCVNERTPNANRSVEVQPFIPVLSPETSTALENAEKIINNAKIQLVEVCATSSFDSARQNRNTYWDEPPLDDEAEERLYVRQLVASKFHNACTSRWSEANGETSSRSDKRHLPRVTVRRIDLSAPKFRASRRRRADWSSLGYGSDDRSRGRAPPARVTSSRDSIRVANETTTTTTTARDDRARDCRRVLSAHGNACEIQMGPSVHIVDRELTRQDLEDVHISPGPSRAESRTNTATYTLCHSPEVSGAPRTRRVRLDTLQRGKPIGKPFTEAVPTIPADVKDSDLGRDNGRIESPRDRNYRQERKDAERASERRETADNKFAEIGASRTDRNEELSDKPRNEGDEGIARGGDTVIRYAEDGGVLCGRNDDDHLRNDENIVDKIEAEEDRSKPSPDGDTSRKAGFPRRVNIASQCQQAESPYRTIDQRYFSQTFNSHNGQYGSRDVSRLTILADDNFDEIDLYRPHLDDLDSILRSNDRKIERVARATRNLSELLSGPTFAIYRLDEDERVSRDAEKLLRRNALNDKDSESIEFAPSVPERSLILATVLRNEDPRSPDLVSEMRSADEDPQGTKSSALTRENSSRNDYTKSSVEESSAFPASADARSPESSMDRSDVTTFSNLAPALSSTRTDQTQACRYRGVASASDQLLKREIRPDSGTEYSNAEILARLLRKGTRSQAAERFVAYILQDEKRSVEGKLASALTEAAITPAAVQKLQKLLDRLREDAGQTEILDILRHFLINVKSRRDANDWQKFSRDAVNSSARTNAPAPSVIDGFTSRGARSYNLKGEHLSDLSEYREMRESARSTARCESTRYFEGNGKKDTDVAPIVLIDVKNQTDKDVDESNLNKVEEEETLPRYVIASSSRKNVTTRMKNQTSESGRIADESNDSGNLDKHLSVSPAVPATSVSVPEAARGSRNNSKNSSKGNSCSEAESLKQIPDIRTDDDGESPERLPIKIASAGSWEERETVATSLVAAIATFENKEDDVNTEKLGGDKSHDVQAHKNQRVNKNVARVDQLIDAQSDVPVETVKNITSEKTRNNINNVTSEVTNERVRLDASPVRSKFVDDDSTKKDVESLREAKVESREKISHPADGNYPADSPARDCVSPNAKNSESSLREVPSRNRQISFDFRTDGKNEEIRKSLTLVNVTAEKRRDGNKISVPRKATRNDNERRSIDSTDTPRKYKMDVLSSSNSSINSSLLDHNDRSTNGVSSIDARKVGTASETSHSEGELYMPSSCSYSLGEVRVLRKRRDLIEDNAMDRDSSVTVLVTRSMLTSLNDSTVSLLESSGHV